MKIYRVDIERTGYFAGADTSNLLPEAHLIRAESMAAARNSRLPHRGNQGC